MHRALGRTAALAAICILLWPTIAHAYVGPGGVLGSLGAALALLGAIIAALVGFLWYPLKRLMIWMRGSRKESSPAEPTGTSDVGPE